MSTQPAVDCDRAIDDAGDGETRVGHCRHDDVDLYIGRHGEDGEHHLANTAIGEPGWLGNPFPVAVFGREESIARYCKALVTRVQRDPAFGRAIVEEVHGRTLGCWCRRIDEEEPRCHGDVLVRVSGMLASKQDGGSK